MESFWGLSYALLFVLYLIWFLLLQVGAPGASSHRAECVNNLKQLSVALQAYRQANGCFPPAYIADKNGKPMHSWRVLILPYFGCDRLYKAYDLTEPWDGPKNKKLWDACPSGFVCPSDRNACTPDVVRTSYVAVVGPNAAWAGEKPRKLGDFAGKASDTVMLVEVGNSGIPWTAPRDLSLDTLEVSEDKSPALVPSNNHGQREEFFFTYDRDTRVNVAMADGSVHYLWTAGRSSEDLHKILEIGACGDASREALFDVGRPNWPNIAALAVWLVSVGTLLVGAVRSRKKPATVQV